MTHVPEAPHSIQFDEPAAHALLERRTRLVAQPVVETRPAAAIQVVPFEVGGQTYAVLASFADSVRSLEGLARVPGAPAFVAGILNVRGSIVAVIDLRRLLDGEPVPGAVLGLVLREEATQLVLLTERVLPVQELQISDLAPGAGALRDSPSARFVRAITPNRLVLLDVHRLLLDPALVVDQGNG